MISRRNLLRGAAVTFVTGSVARPVLAIPASPSQIAFDVIRKGNVIGSHVVRFERTGDDVLARTGVEIKVGFGPLTLFRYKHEAAERWRGDQFVGLETRTDNNGEPLTLSARRVGASVEIISSLHGKLTMPATALPLTHWNIRCMSAPVFNPQDGEALDGPVTPRGMEMVTFGDGQQVMSRRFSKGGEAPIDDWYDDTQTWTRLRATAKDGSIIDYRRTA